VRFDDAAAKLAVEGRKPELREKVGGIVGLHGGF
jgi:hypothetical protein